nr:hypothetical protein [Nitrosomonas nitrosa]
MPTDPQANPYPGLRAFEADEAELFFGRERETDELRRRLRISRFLAVVGSSGSGKSSLVRCGLIPSLHGGFMAGAGSSWHVVITHPGENPIGRLTNALNCAEWLRGEEMDINTRRTLLDITLRDSSLGLVEVVRQARLQKGDNVLVVIDQFEELFRFRRSRATHPPADDAVVFVRLLLDAARQNELAIFVVITMRSEFIGECMAFDQLPEAINAGQYLVPRMSRDAMRAAISKPAVVRGASIAPRLLTNLLNEVGRALDQLPLLQHVLMRTWNLWAVHHTGGEPIDTPHYQATGTMKEALSRHADEALDELTSDDERRIAERIFKTLTESTEDGHGIRRPTTAQRLADICGVAIADIESVIDHFRAPGRAFLQPAAGTRLLPEDIVDISHESLMRLWARLDKWVHEEARATEIYRRLLRSAEQYAAGESSLWRPPELTLGLRWQDHTRPTVAWAGSDAKFKQAMRFLQRSREAHYLKLGLAFASAAVAVFLTIGWWWQEAVTQREKADRQRQENVRLTAELERLSRTSILSKLVKELFVTNPEVAPTEVLEVKVIPHSSRVRVFGIFDTNSGPQRIRAEYAKNAGGIILRYPIPKNAVNGPQSAQIYVQEIGTGNEETHTIHYAVISKHQ